MELVERYMSDERLTRNDQKGHDDGSKHEKPNPRLKWITDVVSAILDAEDIKRSSSIVNGPQRD
jgi:hypothetical protein